MRSLLRTDSATADPTPPEQLRAEIPKPLAELVQWAMARNRDERVPSMAALIKELEPFATEDGFRSQMTALDVTLPKVASPLRSACATQPGASAALSTDRNGRISARAAETVPSLPSRRSNRTNVSAGAFAALAALVVGVLLAANKQAATPKTEVHAPPPPTVVPPAPSKQPKAPEPEALVANESVQTAAGLPAGPEPVAVEAAEAERPRKVTRKVDVPGRPQIAQPSAEKLKPRAPRPEALTPAGRAASRSADDQFRVGRAPKSGDFY